MYKQSQLKRMSRLAGTCRMVTVIVLAMALLVCIVALGPNIALTGQVILGLGTMILVWIMMVSRMRKQATTVHDEAQRTRKYSLDFDSL